MVDLFYPFRSDESRAEYLIDLARQDAFYGPIVEDLCVFGFDLNFPLFGGVGSYQPHSLDVSGPDFQHDFVQEMNRGSMRVQLSFPRLYGRSISAHMWLHELTHFYQDMYGLFLEPLCVNGRAETIPDEKSYVAAYVFCEAMAEVEAIRASWRLKEAGFPVAWRGGMLSEWRALLQLYQQELAAGNEKNAALKIYKAWHDMPQKIYYEERARVHYRTFSQEGAQQIAVPLEEVAGLLPRPRSLPYIPSSKSAPPSFQHGSVASIWRKLFYASSRPTVREWRDLIL